MVVVRSAGRAKGFALVAVLWVIMILSGVLVATLSLVKMESEGVTEEVNAYRAGLVAHTGLSYAVHPSVDRDDPLLSYQSDEFDEGYRVTVSPEGKRFNINTILQGRDKALMRNILKHWGLDESDAASLADAMVDWVDAGDTASTNGAEKDVYESMGFTDRPYNRAFDDLEDVRLVRGFAMAERLRPDWRDWFTLRSEGQLDIHEAKSEFLQVAAEVEESQADEFVSNVKGEDGIYGTEDDAEYPNVDSALTAMASPGGDRRTLIRSRFITHGQILSVESEGRSGRFRAKIIATIQKQGSKPNIIDYKERFSESE